MTQTIRVNDFVYIPSRTKCACRVKPNKGGLIVEDGEIINHIDAQGYLYDFSLAKWVEQPFAFLATPENKEKLEQVYGKLEDIPADEELEKFSEVLNELSNFYNRLNAFNSKLITSEEEEQLNSIKSNLIQMFKERGVKSP